MLLCHTLLSLSLWQSAAGLGAGAGSLEAMCLGRKVLAKVISGQSEACKAMGSRDLRPVAEEGLSLPLPGCSCSCM